MPSSRRCLDLFFTAFFVIHMFITVFIDSQVLLPAQFYPQALQKPLQWYVDVSGDYFVRDKPHFFRGLVFAEMLIQLPLVVANAYGFYHGAKWAATTGLIYGVHTATTLIPILADLVSSNLASKALLMMIYIPYFLIPLVLSVHAVMLQPYSVLSYSTEKKRS